MPGRISWYHLLTRLLQTVPTKPLRKKLVRFASDDTVINPGSSDASTNVPVRELLTKPVLWSVSNYASLALLEIAYRAVQPLFLSTPIELGGLGLTPPTIGAILGSFGVFNGIVQALFFARLVDRFGPKRIFQFGMTMFLPLWVLYPVMSVLAKNQGLTTTVWAVVFFQLALSVLMDMAYGAYLAGLLPFKLFRVLNKVVRVHLHLRHRGRAQQELGWGDQRHCAAGGFHCARDWSRRRDVAVRRIARSQLARRVRCVRLFRGALMRLDVRRHTTSPSGLGSFGGPAMFMTCGYRSLAVCTGSACADVMLHVDVAPWDDVRDDDINDSVPFDLSSLPDALFSQAIERTRCIICYVLLDAAEGVWSPVQRFRTLYHMIMFSLLRSVKELIIPAPGYAPVRTDAGNHY